MASHVVMQALKVHFLNVPLARTMEEHTLMTRIATLQHLVLNFQPPPFGALDAEDPDRSLNRMTKLSCLESIYVRLSGQVWNWRAPEDFSLNLSSLQRLKTVHFDSLWPNALELPAGCSVHATFRSAAGQHQDQRGGIWVGPVFGVHNPDIPLRSALLVGNSRCRGSCCDLLWPLRASKDMELLRIKCRSLALDGKDLQSSLSAFPGSRRLRMCRYRPHSAHSVFQGRKWPASMSI